jgi:hypothetical protein
MSWCSTIAASAPVTGSPVGGHLVGGFYSGGVFGYGVSGSLIGSGHDEAGGGQRRDRLVGGRLLH